MIDPMEIQSDLREHLGVCQELLGVVEREGAELRRPEPPTYAQFIQTKKTLIPRLTQSLDRLRRHRVQWQRFSLAERGQYPEIGALLRQIQDLIMKIIVIDRENEQTLLRRGLIPPREVPSVNRQRPHYVADLYRRQNTV